MKRYLIILSGWAVDEFVWENIVELLSKDFEVFIVTWDKVSSLEGFKEKFMDLINKKNINTFSVIGWSLGALTAMDIFKEFSSRIEHLIFFSATARFIQDENYPFGWNKKIVDRMIYMLKKDPQKTLNDFHKNLFTTIEVSNEQDKNFFEKIKKMDKKYDIESLCLGLEYLKVKDNRECIKNIDHKVLLIHGERDFICHIKLGKYLNNHLKKSELIVLKETGHMPFFTKPNECYGIIKNYIKEGR